MIIIGIVLAFIGLAYLCWLVFVLAIYALPFFAGASAGLATYHSGSGPIAVIIVGAIAGSITLYCRADRLHDAVLAPHSRSDRAPLCSAGRRRGISCRARPRPHRHICRRLARDRGSCRRDHRGSHGLGAHGALCPALDAGQGIAAGVTPPHQLTSLAKAESSPFVVSRVVVDGDRHQRVTTARSLQRSIALRRRLSGCDTIRHAGAVWPGSGHAVAPSVRKGFFSFAPRGRPLVRVTRFPPRLLLSAVGPTRATGPLMA